MIEGIPRDHSIFLSHLHTNASDGMVSAWELFSDIASFQSENQTAVVAAVTDHDTFRGLPQAQKAATHFGVQMVAAMEVTTQSFLRPKHVLAYWEEEPAKPVPYFRSPEWTIDEIKSSGGLVVPAHANAYRGAGSLTSSEIVKLGNRELVDGVESLNGTTNRIEGLRPLLKVLRKNRPVSLLAGSDSHFGGRDAFSSYTLFPGHTISDLFKALKEGKTSLLRGAHPQIGIRDKIQQNYQSNFRLNWARLRHQLQPTTP